jgi:hypothetical protein
MKKLFAIFVCLLSLNFIAKADDVPTTEWADYANNLPRWTNSLEIDEGIFLSGDFTTRSHVAYVGMRNFSRKFSLGFAAGALSDIYTAARVEFRFPRQRRWMPFLSFDLGFNYSKEDDLSPLINFTFGARYSHFYWGGGLHVEFDNFGVIYKFGYTF